MVAQVCDLLDAAAAIARVPLFALIKVREASQDISRKAWVRGVRPEVRTGIIQRSLQHRFVSSDFQAIKRDKRTDIPSHETAEMGTDNVYRLGRAIFGFTNLSAASTNVRPFCFT
jgi:hypothetical protein